MATLAKSGELRKKAGSLGRHYRWGEEVSAYLFLLPSLIIFAAFVFFPLFFSFHASLTRWNLPFKPEFIGLDNFRYLFVDEILWTRKSEARYKVNILTPCVPYTNQELSSFLQRGKIEFKAGIKRFEGVHVPNPCIVKLNLKRKHSTRAA